MTIKLRRLGIGSYETTDGRYFMYRYKPEERVPSYWLTYAASSDTNDEFIGCSPTLRDAKATLAKILIAEGN